MILSHTRASRPGRSSTVMRPRPLQGPVEGGQPAGEGIATAPRLLMRRVGFSGAHRLPAKRSRWNGLSPNTSPVTATRKHQSPSPAARLQPVCPYRLVCPPPRRERFVALIVVASMPIPSPSRRTSGGSGTPMGPSVLPTLSAMVPTCAPLFAIPRAV
jgi:hypothetical protein